MFLFLPALGLRLRSIANDIAAVISMCGSKGFGVVGAVDVNEVGNEVIREVGNGVAGSWMVDDAGDVTVWSNMVGAIKAMSEVIEETVWSQIAGVTVSEMTGPRVSVDANVLSQVEESGASIDMTTNALPALVELLKSANMLNVVLMFHATLEFLP